MSLSVVVPTPRLVCVLCALSAVSLRLCTAIFYIRYELCFDYPPNYLQADCIIYCYVST